MNRSVFALRKVHSGKLFVALAFTALAVALFTAVSTQASQQDGQALTKLKPVKASRVCMVNDTLFPKDQIPVKVGGQTYYGCCEMCKARLRSDKKSRQAIDPVSKKKVDKATAVIGARTDGKVLYFESQKTFEKYNARLSGR